MNGGPQKAMAMSKSLEPVNLTLFRKRVSAGVIKNLEIISYWIARWALNLMPNVLVRDRRGETEKGERGEDRGRDRSDAGTWHANHRQRGGAARHRSPPSALRGSVALPTPCIWISGLINCENKFVLC